MPYIGILVSLGGKGILFSFGCFDCFLGGILFYRGAFLFILSTRETLGAGRMVADGWSVLEAMERNFLPFFEGTKTEGERGVVYKTFLRH